jgi:hypothetical protein
MTTLSILQAFLNVRQCSGVFTHTGIGNGLKGRFYIKQEDMDTFVQLYKAALERNIPLSLTEAHRDFSSVFIDFDFKQESAQRVYTKEHIKATYLAIIREISKYVDCKEADLICYVLEKAAPKNDKVHPFKDGFHLQFPKLVTLTELQHIIRTSILQSEALKDIFGGVYFLNSFEKIYDEEVIDKNSLMMYGSSKDGGESYKVSYCLEGSEGLETSCKESAMELVDSKQIRLLKSF